MNKKVILMADNYLPASFIDSLLKEKGVVGHSKTYVSCDYREGKWSGKLYEIAFMELRTGYSRALFVENYQPDVIQEIRQRTYVHRYAFTDYFEKNPSDRQFYDKNSNNLAVSMAFGVRVVNSLYLSQ